MSPDETLRAAARLLRQGAPVQEFVESLDDDTRRRVRRTIALLPETLRARANAVRLAEGTVPCAYSGRGNKGASHALVDRRGYGRKWPACGHVPEFEGQEFPGVPTCKLCLKSLASGRVGLVASKTPPHRGATLKGEQSA